MVKKPAIIALNQLHIISTTGPAGLDIAALAPHVRQLPEVVMAATGKAIIIDLHRWRNHVMQGPGDVVLAGFTQPIRNRLPTLIAPKPLTLPDRIITKQRCHDLRIILPIRPTGIGSD